MQELLIDRPDRDLFDQLEPAQAALIETRVRVPAAKARVHLPILGVTKPPPVQRIIQATDGRWLVASRFDTDPATLTRGATFAPSAVIRQLDALINAGVSFDEIYIFDELPREWAPGKPVPEMRPLTEWRAARTVEKQETIFALGVAALAGLVEAGRAIGRGAVSLGAAVTSFDPALVGAVRDPATGLWIWALIAKWDEVRA